MKTYREYIKESVRDLMTPKPIEKVVFGLLNNKYKRLGSFDPADWGLTLLDFDDTGGLNDHYVFIFGSPDGRRWKILIDDREERSYFPLWVREIKRGLTERPYRSYAGVEEYLRKRGLVKRVDESVRDMMTPKSVEDLIESFNKRDMDDRRMFLIKLSQERFKTKEEFHEFVRKKLGPTSWKRLSKKINDTFASGLVENMNSTDMDFLLKCILYFTVPLNEGVRDHMTPKSKTDVMNELLVNSTVNEHEEIVSRMKVVGEKDLDFRVRFFLDTLTQLHKDYDFNYLSIEKGRELYDIFNGGGDIMVYDALDNEEDILDNVHDAVKPFGWRVFTLSWLQNYSRVQVIYVKENVVRESVRELMTPKSMKDIGAAVDRMTNWILGKYMDAPVSLSMNQSTGMPFLLVDNLEIIFDRMMKYGNGIYIHTKDNGYYPKIKEFCWEKNIMFTQLTPTDIKIMSGDKFHILLHKMVEDVLNGRTDKFIVRKFNNLMR
jgi:hypothetical protein